MLLAAIHALWLYNDRYYLVLAPGVAIAAATALDQDTRAQRVAAALLVVWATVAITGTREEARGDWTVLTKIVRGGGAADVEINYRLRQIDGQWKVIDVIIENVSLVANYRSQFQDMLTGGSPEKLLAALQEKNTKGQPLKAPGA